MCRGLGATYANGWLIMVGASRTLSVRRSGIRRRHERRRTLPRFEALLGDNTPSPTLRGLRMITKAQVIQWCSLSCVLEVEGGMASSLLPLGQWLVLMEWEPFAWVPWGVDIGLPPGVQCNVAGCWARLSVSLVASFSAGCWGPPPGGPCRLVWYEADRPLPPLAGLVGG